MMFGDFSYSTEYNRTQTKLFPNEEVAAVLAFRIQMLIVKGRFSVLKIHTETRSNMDNSAACVLLCTKLMSQL
jgi:hypothetical protein